MRTWRVIAVLVTLLIPGALSYAQGEPCGSIIGPVFGDRYRDVIVTRSYDDCANPFGVPVADSSPFTLTIKGNQIESGEKTVVEQGGTSDYVFRKGFYDSEWEAFRSAEPYLYRKDGTTLTFINTPPVPVESEYRQLAEQFFGEGIDIELYIRAILYRDGFYEFEFEEDEDRFYDYQQYVRENFVPVYPKLAAGEYTLVWPEFVFGLSVKSPRNPFWEFLIPAASAQTERTPTNLYVINFTIEEETLQPTGASSVLFLPGIMGSRLYEESEECGLGGGVVVRERWLQVSNCDLLRLGTNFLGQSTNNIFTFSDERGRIDRAVLPDLYDSLLDELDAWRDDDLINDYRVIPYDWRLSIDAVINTRYDTATKRLVADGVSSYRDGYLYKALSELVEESLSGKVTIVTHSNGGLVAKGLLRRMSDAGDPLLGKIDQLIMVAAPQVGTPEALIGLLHGTDLGFPGNSDAFLDKETSRLLQNKMAFAHHLLPNQRYFDRVDTAVVTFDEGSLTTPWKNQYGQIRDRATLHRFLDDESGRPKPRSSDLLQPEIVDAALLTYARTMEALLDWTPPQTMSVVQIAGTGLDTTAGITYFTDRQCVRHNFSLSFLGCAEYQPKLGYRVNTVIDGDQTVVVPSALYMPSSEAEQWWVDLPKYNTSGFLGATANRKHSNIFEVDEVVEFVGDKLFKVEKLYNYISTTTPVFGGGSRLTFQLHSPLDLSVVTDEGTVSSSSVEVANGVYRQIGEIQYVSLPANTPNIRLVLRGYATGSFTLDIEERNRDQSLKRQTFSGVPTATTTIVSVPIAPNLPPVELAIDVDGNGTVDMRYDENGQVPIPKVTYADVRTYIQGLPLRSVERKVLLTTLALAEKQFQNRDRTRVARMLERLALQATERLVESYGKRRIMTPGTTTTLIGMLRGLNQ